MTFNHIDSPYARGYNDHRLIRTVNQKYAFLLGCCKASCR